MSVAIATTTAVTLGFDSPAWVEVDRLRSSKHLLTLRSAFRAVGGDRQREDRRKRRQWQHWHSAMDAALDSVRRQTDISPDISMPKLFNQVCQTKSAVPTAACFRFSVFSRSRHHIRFPFPDKEQAFQFTFTKPGAPGWPTSGETITSHKRKRQHSISVHSRRRCIEAVENSTALSTLLAHPKRLLDKRTITERRRIRRKALWKRYRSSGGVVSNDLRR
jgi:hypothetical protein